MPAASLALALPLFLDVVFRPALEPAAIARAGQEALAQIRAIGDDSFLETQVEFRRRLYGDLPYAHPLVGEAASVSRMGPAQLRRLHERAFVPANVVIGAAGDFDGALLAAAVPEGGQSGGRTEAAGRQGRSGVFDGEQV